MIDTTHPRHLDRDAIAKAIVDTGDLSAADRIHLERCAACHSEITRLARDLDRLGELARRYTPEPGRPFRSPDGETRPVARPRWVPALATSVTAMLLFTVTYVGYRRTDPVSPLTPRQFTEQELIGDNDLMARVDRLVENALPEALRGVAEDAESNAQETMDEDLLDWIIPSIEEEDAPIT